MNSSSALAEVSQDLPYTLRSEQTQALLSLGDGKHTFVSLPTGFGKSECFTLFPLMKDMMCPSNFPHVVVLVCPTVALITDHMKNLMDRNLNPYEMGPSPGVARKDICRGKHQVLLGIPEHVVNDDWFTVWNSEEFGKHVCLLAVDEAHCCTEWGTDDFRPEFKFLGNLRAPFSRTPFLFMTATTTKLVRQGCLETFLICPDEVADISVVPDRPNIVLHVVKGRGLHHQTSLWWLIEELRTLGAKAPKTIIFARYMTQVGDIFEFFIGQLGCAAFDGSPKGENRLIEKYHGSIGKNTQKRITTTFTKPDTKLRYIISTVGFGMGVNVPDVERIIHWGVSSSILFYWQEVGRAGRDGRNAEAIMYATARSLADKKTAPDIRSLCISAANGECVRSAVLSQFIAGSPNSSATMPPCTCRNCRCCRNCCQRCPMFS